MEKISVVTILLLAIIAANGFVYPNDLNYWDSRRDNFRDEESRTIGGNLTLNAREHIVNDTLMYHKSEELDEGFRYPSEFLPAKNFLAARGGISASEVFKIIRKMPKGALLHAHSISIVSVDYIVNDIINNVVYQDNLYTTNKNGSLELRFANGTESLDKNFDWKLLRNVRGDREGEIDSKIYDQLSIITNEPDSIYTDINVIWAKLEQVFNFIEGIVQYRPVLEDYLYQQLKELYNDNIIYVELRTSLSSPYDFIGTKYEPIDVLALYKNVTQKFMIDHPDFVGVKIIYAPWRKMTQKETDQFIDDARKMMEEYPDFFAGIDLVGQEDLGDPLKNFVDKLLPIVDRIPTFFHAGETNWYGMDTDENLMDAIMLKSKRIGHAYALLKHPVLLEAIKEKDIALEISPISNQVLLLVKDLRNHPASFLFAEGFPVVISSDDPGIWGAAGLSHDFYEAFMGIMSKKTDIRALKQLALNSIKYSSMNEQEKTRASQIWQRQWDSFINSTIARRSRTDA